MLQLTHVDNRGDRDEYPSGDGIEYAWATRFDMIGGQIGTNSPTTLLAEYAWGKTGMGHAPNFVDAGFYAGYLLVSHKFARYRTSVRLDTFGTRDRDRALENNSERATCAPEMMQPPETIESTASPRRSGSSNTNLAGGNCCW